MPITHRTFVSYIDRTREFYRAQGYPDAYAWARHTDAPFAPLPKPLAECTLGLVTTAGPWREQKALDGVLRGGKQVYSAPVEPPPKKLFTGDLAWDRIATHTDDVPSFLPIPQFQACTAEGRLGALAARFHGVPTDYSQRRTTEQDAPEILARLRADAVDVAILVPL
jgi:D-proline reductase (dithiol) PrdB